jgi:hypothetical protein
MNYGELQKCYPEFKIPVAKHAEYYVDTLLESGYVSEKPLLLLKNLEENKIDIYKAKKEFMNKVLDYFKEREWDFQIQADKDVKESHDKFNSYNCDYELKEFNDYKAEKFYVSVDLKSANWQSFKQYFDLDLPEWEHWLVQSGILPHKFFACSKSIRQFIFGNTNPKRLQKVQRWMMNDFLKSLPADIQAFVVGRNSDELILELGSFDFDVLALSKIDDAISKSPYLFSKKCFRVWMMENFDDTVKIKETIDETGMTLSKQFLGLSGNRFFLHLKTILMKEELDYRDVLFENDNKLASWVL